MDSQFLIYSAHRCHFLRCYLRVLGYLRDQRTVPTWWDFFHVLIKSNQYKIPPPAHYNNSISTKSPLQLCGLSPSEMLGRILGWVAACPEASPARKLLVSRLTRTENKSPGFKAFFNSVSVGGPCNFSDISKVLKHIQQFFPEILKIYGKWLVSATQNGKSNLEDLLNIWLISPVLLTDKSRVGMEPGKLIELVSEFFPDVVAKISGRSSCSSAGVSGWSDSDRARAAYRVVLRHGDAFECFRALMVSLVEGAAWGKPARERVAVVGSTLLRFMEALKEDTERYESFVRIVENDRSLGSEIAGLLKGGGVQNRIFVQQRPPATALREVFQLLSDTDPRLLGFLLHVRTFEISSVAFLVLCASLPEVQRGAGGGNLATSSARCVPALQERIAQKMLVGSQKNELGQTPAEYHILNFSSSSSSSSCPLDFFARLVESIGTSSWQKYLEDGKMFRRGFSVVDYISQAVKLLPRKKFSYGLQFPHALHARRHALHAGQTPSAFFGLAFFDLNLLERFRSALELIRTHIPSQWARIVETGQKGKGQIFQLLDVLRGFQRQWQSDRLFAQWKPARYGRNWDHDHEHIYIPIQSGGLFDREVVSVGQESRSSAVCDENGEPRTKRVKLDAYAGGAGGGTAQAGSGGGTTQAGAGGETAQAGGGTAQAGPGGGTTAQASHGNTMRGDDVDHSEPPSSHGRSKTDPFLLDFLYSVPGLRSALRTNLTKWPLKVERVGGQAGAGLDSEG